MITRVCQNTHYMPNEGPKSTSKKGRKLEGGGGVTGSWREATPPLFLIPIGENESTCNIDKGCQHLLNYDSWS